MFDSWTEVTLWFFFEFLSIIKLVTCCIIFFSSLISNVLKSILNWLIFTWCLDLLFLTSLLSSILIVCLAFSLNHSFCRSVCQLLSIKLPMHRARFDIPSKFNFDKMQLWSSQRLLGIKHPPSSLVMASIFQLRFFLCLCWEIYQIGFKYPNFNSHLIWLVYTWLKL